MSYYENNIFPLVNNLLTKSLNNHRKENLVNVSGDLLEIGFGVGLSIPAYPNRVRNVIGIEPSDGMFEMAKKQLVENSKFEIIKASAEKLPFKDDHFDGVVSFLTLCTVDDLPASIKEIKRVLRPGGKVFFIEHIGQPVNTVTRKIQNLIQPLWKKVACGCNLNRETLTLLEQCGFEISEFKILGHSGFPNILAPLVRGVATMPN